MNEIHRIIRAASRRLWLIDLFRTLSVALTIGLAGLLVARIIERTFGLTLPWTLPFGGVFAATGTGVALVAIGWSIARRKREAEVAFELDERAGLRESLSTALCVAKSEDPWSRAMIETARGQAASVKVREAIPMQPPRFWPVPLGTAAALAILWFTLPSFDVMGILRKKNEVQRQAQRVQEVKAVVEAKTKILDDLLAKAKVDFKPDDSGSKSNQTGTELQKPEEIQRAAVKKLTDMKDRLNGIKNGEKGEQAQSLKDALKQLRQPNDGPLSDFQRSLANGNFAKAEAALQDMTQKMADGSMSDAQKEVLKKQMQSLGDQLKKLSQKNDDLQKKLEAAGMDPKKAAELLKKLAENPDALKKALEQMKNLTPEQQQKLAQMAQAASKSAQQESKMGEAMSKMAEGMDKQGMNQEGTEGAQQMGEELGQAEMLSQEMDSLSAALNEAGAQLAELGEPGDGQGSMEGDPHLGDWREGEGQMGNGSGGPGRGNYGGPRPDNAQDFSLKKEKANVATGKGPIIGTRLVYGDQVKGEAQAEFSAAAEAAEKNAAEAIDNQLVPRELQGSVKNYFGRLTKKGAVPGAANPVAPKSPAKDTKDAPKK